MSLRIGLTGGIASGKSTATPCFVSLGIQVIDADLIAREVVQPGSQGLRELVGLFGHSILNSSGELDRKALRNIVFSDDARTSQLNECLHPKIKEQLLHRSQNATGPYHILDIPLLVETQWQHQLDRVIVIDCDESIQIERIIQRDGGTRAQAKNIIDQQATRAQRLQIADDVIDNNGDVAQMAAQVYKLHLKYLRLARIFHQ